VIEAQIYAPGGGGGGGRAAKRQRAQELIEASACQVGRAASLESGLQLSKQKHQLTAACACVTVPAKICVRVIACPICQSRSARQRLPWH